MLFIIMKVLLQKNLQRFDDFMVWDCDDLRYNFG